MNGFLLIDKPSGISSSGCVYNLRKILKLKKIGHCGTLDPLATGVLPICIGEATKFSDYITEQQKEYLVTVKFGLETDTGDILGKEISRAVANFSKVDLELTLKQFVGIQKQIVPMYSAIKLNGRPLYYWARKGVYLKRKPRAISINSIRLLTFKGKDKATIKVLCSKGTYIRTLVESIGRELGTKATVLGLRRTKVGSFGEKDLCKLEKLEKTSFSEAIIDCDKMLKHLPKITLNSLKSKKIRNGLQVDYNARQEKEGIVRIYEEKGSFIGIGSIDFAMKVSPKRLLKTQTNQTSFS